MNFAALTPYLKLEKPSAADFTRFLRMVLQGLSTHVIGGDSEELTGYRKEVGQLVERMDENSSSEDILLAVSMALRSLEDYNQRTKKYILAHTLELKKALRTTTETVVLLMRSRVQFGEHLTSVERKLEEASGIEDVRELRHKLQECLSLVRAEDGRLREESVQQIDPRQKDIVAATQVAEADPHLKELDPATGLESSFAAEKLISHKIALRKRSAVALFVVNRLTTINRRFGRKVGDEVLMEVAQHLGQLLPANSELFRWSGTALAAVVEIETNFEDVNRKLVRIASGQLEKKINEGERSVFILTLLLVQNLSGTISHKDVVKRMHEFVSLNSSDE